MRVAFVIIDALPNRLVSEELTPNLWQLAMEGGWNPKGGLHGMNGYNAAKKVLKD